MFLECRRTNVSVPKSTMVSLIFPFDQCSYKFKRSSYNPDALDDGKYAQENINDVIDEIEKSCDNFDRLRRFRNGAILSSVFFAFCIIFGNVFLNIGLYSTTKDGVKLIRYQQNGFVYAGGIILGLGLVQFAFIMVSLALKTRKLRVVYEERTREILETLNHAIKGKGLRWKLGQFFTWIELSLDYKVESAITPGSKRGFDTLLIPHKFGGPKNFL